jgi:hypothetical protein
MLDTCATGKLGEDILSRHMCTGALRVNTRSAPHIQCATGSSATYSCFSSSGEAFLWKLHGIPWLRHKFPIRGVLDIGGGDHNLNLKPC